MMGHIRRHSEARVVLFVGIIGLIGFSTIDAWAVANRINMANADARALVKSDIEIVFDDGTTETTRIQEDGSFTTSKPVTERNVDKCFIVKKTATGEEKRELPNCAWLWGGGEATGMASSGTGQAESWADVKRTFGIAEIDLTGYGGFGFTVPTVKNQQTSNLGGFGSFSESQDYGNFTSAFGKGGLTFLFNNAFGVDNVVLQISGTKYSGRNDKVNADLDPFSAGKEASQTFKLLHAINVGVGKRFICPHLFGGKGGYFDAVIGLSAVRYESTLSILEAGNRQMFTNSGTQYNPYGSIDAAWPVLKLGDARLDITAGLDVRYIQSTESQHRSALGLTYGQSTKGFADFNPNFGIRFAF